MWLFPMKSIFFSFSSPSTPVDGFSVSVPVSFDVTVPVESAGVQLTEAISITRTRSTATADKNMFFGFTAKPPLRLIALLHGVTARGTLSVSQIL